MSQALNHPPAITVDVEDWPQSTWDHNLPITLRAADNTHRVLDQLASLEARATMFVLGRLARKYPDVVRRIHAEGHEVASHGDGHIEVFKLGPKAFAEDIRRSKGDLEDITGQRVMGYRAPDFSIGADNLWALEVLAESGFDYDSSIFPVKAARYGIPHWPLTPVRVKLGSGRDLTEFPISTVRLFGRNWPLGGGGYQRLLPGFLFRFLSGRVMRKRPFVLYCHPYEFDAGEFSQLDFDVPWSVRLHQGMGRRFVPGRFKSFVRKFGGCRLGDLCQYSWPVFTPAESNPALGHARLSGDKEKGPA